MEKVNEIIRENPIHLTTNTIILIVVAIIAVYVLIKAVSGIIKITAIVGICLFVLMSLQSTNLINIPVIRETYNAIESVIPSKELWTKVVDKAEKINNAANALK
jgi:hypothetical protein